MKRPRAIRATPLSDSATADDNLIAWAAKRADWSRDALRRHAMSAAFALSAADKAEVIKRVRYAAELDTEEVPVYEPLTTDHVKDTGQLEPRTLLCSLGPVRHLNRLAPDQQMHFATNGLTLVLGDNGTGKSGYARVAKKMCRSLSKDDLLGNVFEPGAQVPAEILVRYQVDGAPVTDVTWIDDTPTPSPLASMSFFDSQNARLYVDRENRINYLPPDISLLERHGVHCAEMDATFRAELGEVQKRVKIPLPSGYSAGGAVALLLARLDPNKKDLPTTEEIKALAKANDNDATELQRLELLLAHDPAELAARCRRAKAALERSAAQISAAATALSSAQATALETLQDEAHATAQASALAASARFASEPLKDVGSEPWRLMYDYAKAFFVCQITAHLGNRCWFAFLCIR